MNNAHKKILLSGTQATGRPHIGNYFGAMKQFADLQNEYLSHIMIADYHSLNTIRDAGELSRNILGVATDYLAIGLDPEKVVIFQQSAVPEHTELAWIFNTLTTMPYLMRAHAFKDAEAKGKEISVGTFDYPMLMAADILLYSPDVVPVGQDQKQHVEISRDTAEKFNHLYGDTFKLPKEIIMDDVKVVPGTDGRKMSKSYGNTIPLFASDEEIRKAVMSIPTDSKGIDEPKDIEHDNVFALHKLFPGFEFAEVQEKYMKGGMGYKESKEILIKNISRFIAPLREARIKIESDKEYVLDVLREGGKKAKKIAEAKMEQVRERVGVKLY